MYSLDSYNIIHACATLYGLLGRHGERKTQVCNSSGYEEKKRVRDDDGKPRTRNLTERETCYWAT